MNRKSKTNRRLMRMADHQQDRERALRIESPDTRSTRKGQIEFFSPPGITQYNEGTITPRGIDTPSRDTA